tara:strand:- start:953 stop:1162 length:210 start_codon:yes stop_codon:yes gene_type:complete
MKVTKITIGYYKITIKTSTYYVSCDDMQKLWVVELLIDNSDIGMRDSLEHVTSLSTLRDCKLAVESLHI